MTEEKKDRKRKRKVEDSDEDESGGKNAKAESSKGPGKQSDESRDPFPWALDEEEWERQVKAKSFRTTVDKKRDPGVWNLDSVIGAWTLEGKFQRLKIVDGAFVRALPESELEELGCGSADQKLSFTSIDVVFDVHGVDRKNVLRLRQAWTCAILNTDTPGQWTMQVVSVNYGNLDQDTVAAWYNREHPDKPAEKSNAGFNNASWTVPGSGNVAIVVQSQHLSPELKYVWGSATSIWGPPFVFPFRKFLERSAPITIKFSTAANAIVYTVTDARPIDFRLARAHAGCHDLVPLWRVPDGSEKIPENWVRVPGKIVRFPPAPAWSILPMDGPKRRAHKVEFGDAGFPVWKAENKQHKITYILDASAYYPRDVTTDTERALVFLVGASKDPESTIARGLTRQEIYEQNLIRMIVEFGGLSVRKPLKVAVEEED